MGNVLSSLDKKIYVAKVGIFTNLFDAWGTTINRLAIIYRVKEPNIGSIPAVISTISTIGAIYSSRTGGTWLVCWAYGSYSALQNTRQYSTNSIIDYFVYLLLCQLERLVRVIRRR